MKDNKKILEKMSIEEKINLLSGNDFWKLESIPEEGLSNIMLSDGPHGLRKQVGDTDHVGLAGSVPATCFPTASAIACSWDKELIHHVGEALGNECLNENISVLLGPGINVKRHPLCGRNFEYFSEDPFLSGKLAASWINGVQSKGIGTSLKHYVANNQENMRMVTNSIIDERTLREIYLKGFEIAVKESNPWTVMSSYNLVNGTYVGEHPQLLKEILKDEWKYEGVVVTDWGAINDRVEALKNGLDLEMPSSKGAQDKLILKALESEEISVDDIDQAALRIIDLIQKSHESLSLSKMKVDYEKHHEIARKAASQSMVLLKNEDEILPINKTKKVALIGEFAKNPRYQGSGSSLIVPKKLRNAYDAFYDVLGENLLYAKGYDATSSDIDHQLEKEAIDVAMKADVVVIMAGLTDDYESEGIDRMHLSMPQNHNHLIDSISKHHKQVVVSLANGAPILMPWHDKVSGIIEQYLTGEASGEALADIVFGDVNPSGKLAETFPMSLSDVPADQNFSQNPIQVEYREGLYVGYRGHEKGDTPVLYPFGYGLSYTTYEYDQLQISKAAYTNEESIELEFCLKNTGKRSGDEIVQLYVGCDDSKVYRPKKELKGFEKVHLEAGESKIIKVTLPVKELAIYQKDKFIVESGTYQLYIGASSQDIRLKESIMIDSKDNVQDDGMVEYKAFSKDTVLSQQSFELLLGKKVPEAKGIKPYHINSTLGQMKDHWIGNKMYQTIEKQLIKPDQPLDEASENMLKIMLNQLPFRSMILFSEGKISLNRAEGILDIMNGKYLKGIGRVVKG